VDQKKLAVSFAQMPALDPSHIQEAAYSLTSTVSIDLDGVPLKTTLRLMLKQLGLAFTVKDGLLKIGAAKGIRKQ
jgi:hypothetical protein